MADDDRQVGRRGFLRRLGIGAGAAAGVVVARRLGEYPPAWSAAERAAHDEHDQLARRHEGQVS